ncbi:2-dehydro-3,6-dideoxy-6-sulfogluconate aldolase [Rhodovastum atsumiense]|uniref:2-dehydro-3-deoxyglucarate aldolase n=1 Tax=Rhodovastum atsumiense TaxID=504468 RepID=A0A5M6ILM6_9PROT|nr:aldolase/citrate lyase family protein [Rhodovastum atsumiense]KAA5609082.1 2-dehydro-3-deoxyglucarate aldolase [Rhodovastum atsumiense]CAH2602164.1 2-dehydro-3,6-dideoxy-6-sulfogluconate aldolase [Rhodovastum atsumiense]
MDVPTNQFKQWLSQRRQPAPLGTWMMTGSAAVAEALGYVGFDYLVLDTEHVPVDQLDVGHILRALAGTPTREVLLRLPWNDAVAVKRALDAGAQSLMFPFIQTAEEARRAVAAARYPQDGNGGTRGVAAVHRASRYGAIGDYLRQANAQTCVVLQLETPEAVARMPEIAAVDGVDAIFIGPADLSANMGHLGGITHPEVQAALRQAVQSCTALGKPCGIVGGNPDLVGTYLEWGYAFVAIASDMSMLLARAREQIAAVRGRKLAIAGGAGY